MLNFMNFWFGCFVFGGFLIPQRDMYYPFELFYHIMPFSYYARSAVYVAFDAMTFEPCTVQGNSPVCVDSSNGLDVLDGLGRVMPLVSSEDTVITDLIVLIVIGAVWKLFYIVGVVYKTTRVSKFHES
jgi:hypothetical protein